MAKFKKNFWNGTRRKEDGDVVETPEPSWYAREKDPLDRLGGFHNPNKRPEGVTIPRAKVGEKIVPIKEAYLIYKRSSLDSFRLNSEPFKTALINGSTFQTREGRISKP